jgi:hypothetical protein
MAVVEASSIVTLFESNGMLSKSYNVDDLKNDLNTLFPSFDYANISEVIKYIATTTSAPIRNRHDLNVLTLDKKSAKQRSDAYKQFDETLSLSSVDEFKYDPDLVIPKIKYCKIFGYPYCDDNGVLFAIYGALLVESLFTLVKLLFDFFGFLFKNENPLFFSLGFSFSWKLFKKLLLLLIGSGFKKFNPGKEVLG